jgi:hypothetical protein
MLDAPRFGFISVAQRGVSPSKTCRFRAVDDTRCLVMAASPGFGATAACTSVPEDPSVNRPLSRLGAKDWFFGLTSG